MTPPTGSCRSWPCERCGGDGMNVRRDNLGVGGWRCNQCGHFERDKITTSPVTVVFAAAFFIFLFILFLNAAGLCRF